MSTQDLGYKMLNFPADTKNEAKCSITHGTMGHVDPKQPPNKRKPFVTILNHQFIQKVSQMSLKVKKAKVLTS